MLNISNMMNRLPAYVAENIIDLQDCNTKKGPAIRVTLDVLLTENELQELKKNKRVLFANTCYYRNAPEIKKTYFYYKA